MITHSLLKIDSIIDNCYRDCHNKYFHTFTYSCIYDIKLKNITNNEIFNITISDESMNLFELNKKLTLARRRGFRFLQINKLTIKLYSHQRYINISYYLNHRIPIMHRQYFKILSQNRDYVQTHCNDRNNPFHFACQNWIKNCMYFYNLISTCFFHIKEIVKNQFDNHLLFSYG